MPISNIDPINAMTGYTQKTTYWADFSIAERFGQKAIQDTFDVALAQFGMNIEYMTELALTMNHKTAVLFESDRELASLYNNLWLLIDNYIFENFQDNNEALSYYLETTD